MKKSITIFIFILTLSLVNSSCSTCEGDVLSETEQNLSYEQEIMVEINQFRIQNKKDKLKPSSIIKTQTDKHTVYMIDGKAISHDFFQEKRVPYLKKNLKSNSHSENVAYNYSTKAVDVFNQWKNSPGHRKNILGNYTHAYVTAKKNEKNNRWYYTAIFAKVK